VTLLGIDIGGTGIKGAPVDVETGNSQASAFESKLRNLRCPTPSPMWSNKSLLTSTIGVRPALPFRLSLSTVSPIRPPTSIVHGSARMQVSSFPDM